MKKIVLREDFLIPDTDIIAEPGDELYIEPAMDEEDDIVVDTDLADNNDYDYGEAPVDVEEEDGEDVSAFDPDLLDNDDLDYAERRLRNARCRAGICRK